MTTLVPADDAVTLGAASIDKDGVAADSCSGQSAAGALELATRGNWNGTWSACYNAYFITSIGGLALPRDRRGVLGVLGQRRALGSGDLRLCPKPGDSLLFFPDCYGKTCPKSAGVLGVKAAAVVDRRSLLRRSRSPRTPTPRGRRPQAARATVSGGGASAKTAANGTATLSLHPPGRFTLTVTKPDTVRHRAVRLRAAAAAKTCE